jgi:hypothetical protein
MLGLLTPQDTTTKGTVTAAAAGARGGPCPLKPPSALATEAVSEAAAAGAEAAATGTATKDIATAAAVGVRGGSKKEAAAGVGSAERAGPGVALTAGTAQGAAVQRAMAGDERSRTRANTHPNGTEAKAAATTKYVREV